jgi:hypothetical protein
MKKKRKHSKEYFMIMLRIRCEIEGKEEDLNDFFV